MSVTDTSKTTPTLFCQHVYWHIYIWNKPNDTFTYIHAYIYKSICIYMPSSMSPLTHLQAKHPQKGVGRRASRIELPRGSTRPVAVLQQEVCRFSHYKHKNENNNNKNRTSCNRHPHPYPRWFHWEEKEEGNKYYEKKYCTVWVSISGDDNGSDNARFRHSWKLACSACGMYCVYVDVRGL